MSKMLDREFRAIAKEIKDLKKDIIEWDRAFYADYLRKQAIREMVKDFNPDTHVIVTKEQLDLTNQLKALTTVSQQVEEVKTGVDFIVSRYTKPDLSSPKSSSKEEAIMNLKAKWINPK